MAVYSEEAFPIEIGFGLYTAELPSGIPNGYCQESYNTVASGESQENRLGYNYLDAVGYYVEQPVVPENQAFSLLYTDNPDYPILGWPDGNYMCFIRGSARLSGTTPSGDGFMRANNGEASVVFSMAQYGTITYFSNGIGVRKITSYNWVSDSFNSSSVTTAVTGLYGMFTFKDRMWGFKGNTLYFTNPATTTVLPETWSAVTQAIPVEGPNGSGEIVRVVPVGSRLLIFTSNGLFALTVQGEPASWIFKSLDGKSLSNHRQCAFERNNLVYYVNSLGVNVTDGYEVTKLSSSIDDKFVSYIKGNSRYSLNFLNDGMLLCLTKIFKHTNNSLYYDKDFTQVFYSRLDTIAWTEWNLENYQDEGNGLYKDQNIATILSSSDSIYTFLSPDPLSFMLLVTTRSVAANPLNSVFQLCTYDGASNKLKVNIQGGSVTVYNEPIHIKIRTCYSDFGQGWNLKNIKYAFGEVFTNTAAYDFETWWILDNTTDQDKSIQTAVVGSTPGEGTNLVKITAGFHTRRAGLAFRTYLQNVNAQIKIKNFVAIMHSERREFKEIR